MRKEATDALAKKCLEREGPGFPKGAKTGNLGPLEGDKKKPKRNR